MFYAARNIVVLSTLAILPISVHGMVEHNSGKSLHTKKYLPWELVYCEGYANEQEAKEREKRLKQFGRVYARLKVRIKHSLQSEIKARG